MALNSQAVLQLLIKIYKRLFTVNFLKKKLLRIEYISVLRNLGSFRKGLKNGHFKLTLVLLRGVGQCDVMVSIIFDIRIILYENVSITNLYYDFC